MTKGMNNQVMERYCQEVSNKENEGRVEQLRYYPPYKMRTK